MTDEWGIGQCERQEAGAFSGRVKAEGLPCSIGMADCLQMCGTLPLRDIAVSLKLRGDDVAPFCCGPASQDALLTNV